jgi:hypothetical protein
MSVHAFPPRDGNVPRDAHPDIVMLVRYWQYIHPEGRLPGSAHFNLDDNPGLRPNMRLLDVVPSEMYRYRVRMIGAGHLRQLGYDPTGRWYDEITHCFQNSIVELDLARVCNFVQPVYRKGQTIVPYVSGNRVIERVHVPLASDGKNVDCIASLTLFFPTVQKSAGSRSPTGRSSVSDDGNRLGPYPTEAAVVATGRPDARATERSQASL